MMELSEVLFRHIIAGCALMGVFCGSASATASLSCTAKDENIEFDLLAHIGSVPNAQFSLSHGQLKLNARGGGPEITVQFAPDNLGQQWYLDPDLRLRVYREGDPAKPETDVILITKKASEDRYRGQYQVTVKTNGKQRRHTGRVICELGY